MTCPRCGCPAYTVQGHSMTLDDDGQMTSSPTLTIAACCGCGLQLERLPGRGVVSTYPRGPFEEGDAP